MANQTDHNDKLTSLLGEFETTMFVSKDEDGTLHSRPMSVIRQESSDDLWFLTSLQAALVDEIKRDARVNLSFQSKRAHLAIEGRAELIHDRARIQQLWSKPMELWFPDGPTDPNVVAIRVNPENAEFWDERGLNGVRFALRSIKALVTGERIEHDASEHGRVKM